VLQILLQRAILNYRGYVGTLRNFGNLISRKMYLLKVKSSG